MDRTDNRTLWWWIGGAAVVLLLLIIVVPALSNRTTSPALPNTGGRATAETKVSDINASPAAYVGQQVTVTGKTENVQGARMFVLNSSGDRIPVVNRTGSTILENGNDVAVSGTVRIFDVEQIQSEFGLTLDPASVAGFAGKAVIVSDVVQLTD